MKRIAVITSGGDAPGMNAAIRAVTRAAIDRRWEVIGVQSGFQGLMEGRFRPLGNREVSGIIERGGTMLGSARAPDFRTTEGRQRAVQAIDEAGIGAVVVIGGNGSQTGADALGHMGVPVVGIASTIDNDLLGSDITIGVDTALDVALESIDRLKVTASSHKRAFLVEVMGRDCGYLALAVAIAGGAEAVVVPEVETTPDRVAQELIDAHARGKSHALVVVAEGAGCNATLMAHHFKSHADSIGFDLRVTVLGHVQRGGTPGAFDRLLASRLGVAAVDALARGERGVLLGLRGGRVGTTPYADVVGRTKPIDPELLRLAEVLAQ